MSSSIETLDRLPGRLDILVVAGDTFADAWRFTEDDDVTPIDISGATFKGVVKRRLTTAKVAEFVFDSTTEGADGILGVMLPVAADMLGSYGYDIEMTDALGTRTILAGTLYAKGQTT
jgi:hypothetical protein